MAAAVGRAGWVAFRGARHGLTGAADGDAIEVLLRLGIQDSPAGAAADALAARRGVRAQDDLVVAWSVRGAPHLHRLVDLEWLRAAQQVVDDDDASARLLGWHERIVGTYHPARLIADIAEAMGEIVATRTGSGTTGVGGTDGGAAGGGAGAMSKGDLSTEVSRRLPDATFWCEKCQAQHVPDIAFRLATLQARLYVTQTNPTVLAPWPEAARTGDVDADEARAELAGAFLRAQGAASRALFATWLGAGRSAVAAAWAAHDAELKPVTVEGRRYVAFADDADGLAAGTASDGVAEAGQAFLLPGRDPYLQGADKQLLVPDAEHRKQVWRPVQWPGALIVGGEVVGTWRQRTRGTTLDVTVAPFPGAPEPTPSDLDKAATRLAEARGLAHATVQLP